MSPRGRSPKPEGNITGFNWLPVYQLICCILNMCLGQNMLHMQHHFLCNISFVVIVVSVGIDLKYTTSNSCKTLIGVHEMHGRMHPN